MIVAGVVDFFFQLQVFKGPGQPIAALSRVSSGCYILNLEPLTLIIVPGGVEFGDRWYPEVIGDRPGSVNHLLDTHGEGGR